MKRFFLSLIVLTCFTFGIQAQVVYEDFEGGVTLPWNGSFGDGTFNGAVANPADQDPLGINASAMVGSYTKSNTHAFSLLIAILDAPMDLSVNNQFSVQINSPVPTKVLLKLEGAGEAIEQIKNIAITDTWIQYDFDFSGAAGFTTADKIILFFDPGVETSGDNYLFDNIVANPAGPCAGTVADPHILDDFECQRNATIANPGFLDVTPVANPDMSGINTSSTVGEYNDAAGAEWHALVYDWNSPGDFPVTKYGFGIVKIKVWAPVTGILKFKLEAGDSPAVEKDAIVTETNKWVEYEADFRDQVGESHRKLVLFFNAGVVPGPTDIYYIDDLGFQASPTGMVLEDFENGPKLNWQALDGDFLVTENPSNLVIGGDPAMINPSDSVGVYVKDPTKPFSLLLAELDEPLDMSVYNQFKIQVASMAWTKFILKLEGPGGQAIEGKKNIGVGAWQEYTFDFSAASDLDSLNKIILFFDYGTEMSQDTYFFDNIVIEPAGPCAGTIPDPLILDDYECQRNTTYGFLGFTDILPGANPDPSGINTSPIVGRYQEQPGPWAALLLDYRTSPDPWPLVEGASVLKMKVWAPVTGILKFKLEGGGSPIVEKDAFVTETNTWVEYKVDFTDQVGADHDWIIFFFNAGVEPDTNDVYYIDDIAFEAPATGDALEDFEDGPRLMWSSLGDPGVFGTFDGAITNPDPTGVNVTDNVGSYTKGSSQFGGLKAGLPLPFSLEQFPQLNLQIWAPSGATGFTMKLFSPTQGLKDVSVDITETETWTDLNFIFSDFSSITDFEEVQLQFDENLATTDTWYFDNLDQGSGTVDPCEGVEPVFGIVDDFDCQRNVTFNPLDHTVEVILNPDASGINPDPLDKVLQVEDPFGEWSAVVWDFGGSIDLATFNQLHIKVWSPQVVPLLFKLEGGTSAPAEVFMDVSATDSWVEYIVDFSGQAAEDHTKIALFFNAGNVQPEQYVYFIDDVEWRRSPFTGLIADYETPATSFNEWTYFANGSLEGTVFAPVTNPDQSGVNTSENVGIFLEANDGDPWAGMFSNNLPAPIALPNNNKTIHMKVWADHAGMMTMKLEQGLDGAPGSGDNNVMYDTPNEWAELVWDYTALVPDDALYARLTLIFDIENIPTETKTYYFDDIAIAGMTTSIFELPDVESLSLYPNPATETIVIGEAQDLYSVEIMSIMGQKMGYYRTSGQQAVELDLGTLSKGMYIIAAFDKQGVLKATGKFLKE